MITAQAEVQAEPQAEAVTARLWHPKGANSDATNSNARLDSSNYVHQLRSLHPRLASHGGPWGHWIQRSAGSAPLDAAVGRLSRPPPSTWAASMQCHIELKGLWLRWPELLREGSMCKEFTCELEDVEQEC